MGRTCGGGQRSEVCEKGGPTGYVSSRELTRDERMYDDQAPTQKIHKKSLSVAKMSNPDGSIDEDHYPMRRRGMFEIFG